METRGARIRHVRTIYGLTQEAFADRLRKEAARQGRTLSRGAVGNWERNKGITIKNLTLITDVFPLAKMDWLANNRGPIPQADIKRAAEKGAGGKTLRKPKIVESFDPDGTDDDDGVPHSALHTEGRLNIPQGEIPEVFAKLGLGHAADAETITVPLGEQSIAALKIVDTWKVPLRVLRRRLSGSVNDVHIVECEGDSMEPRIRDGDFVFIDTSRRTPSPPGIFALYDGIGQTLKRVELVPNTDPPRIKLIPENPRHETYERALDEVSIIGRYLCRLTMD